MSFIIRRTSCAKAYDMVIMDHLCGFQSWIHTLSSQDHFQEDFPCAAAILYSTLPPAGQRRYTSARGNNFLIVHKGRQYCVGHASNSKINVSHEELEKTFLKWDCVPFMFGIIHPAKMPPRRSARGGGTEASFTERCHKVIHVQERIMTIFFLICHEGK